MRDSIRSNVLAVIVVLAAPLIAVVLLMLPGCAPVQADYVKSDRRTYDAIAPSHLRYVAADDSLTLREKQRRYDTIQTWKLRVDKSTDAPLAPSLNP